MKCKCLGQIQSESLPLFPLRASADTTHHHSAVYPGHLSWSFATLTVTKMQINTLSFQQGCDKVLNEKAETEEGLNERRRRSRVGVRRWAGRNFTSRANKKTSERERERGSCWLPSIEISGNSATSSHHVTNALCLSHAHVHE